MTLTEKINVIKNNIALSSPAAVIYWLALYTICWGLWLMIPFWSVFDASPALHLLSGLGPEWLVGCVFFTIGVAKFIILWYSLFTNKIYVWSIITNFVLFIFWSIVAVSITLTDWQGSGTVTYSFIALISLWATAHRWAEYKLQELKEA